MTRSCGRPACALRPGPCRAPAHRQSRLAARTPQRPDAGHGRPDDARRQRPRRIRPLLGANAAPAGGVASSANDMALDRIQLARRGAARRVRLFSETSAREMWTPRVHIPISPMPEPAAWRRRSSRVSALGWNERDYRGIGLIMHTRACRCPGHHHSGPGPQGRVLGDDQFRGRRGCARRGGSFSITTWINRISTGARGVA